MTSEPTTLYRLYSSNDELPYIGVAGNPGRRFAQHAGDKPWWGDVSRIALQHYPSRRKALQAETATIRIEQPVHNIVHKSPRPPHPSPSNAHHPAGGPWIFHGREGHFERIEQLTLYPELDGSSCVDEIWHESITGEEELTYYIDYLKRERAEWWETDAIPILWSIQPVSEIAPFQAGEHEDFLTFYTWPHNRQGQHLDWFRLPVLLDRFPNFATALGWKPAPLQPTAPLRSIMASNIGGVL